MPEESELFIDEVFHRKYYISVINRIELLGCKDLSDHELEALSSFIVNPVTFDLDENIVLETIRIRQEYVIKLPDAIIAATCLTNNCHLITNNIKDFDKIEGLQIVEISPSAR